MEKESGVETEVDQVLSDRHQSIYSDEVPVLKKKGHGDMEKEKTIALPNFVTKFHVWNLNVYTGKWERCGVDGGYDFHGDATGFVKSFFGKYTSEKWIITTETILVSNLLKKEIGDG